MDYVDNLLDAKKFLVNDINGAFDRKIKRIANRQALFSGGFCNVILLVVSIITHRYDLVLFSLPLFLWAASAYSAVFQRYLEKKIIINGRYFINANPEKIIAQANVQIDALNEEQNRMRKKHQNERGTEIQKKL